MPPQQPIYQQTPVNQPVYPVVKQSKVPLFITGTLLVLALAFGLWAFGKMQDYKSHTDAKIKTALAAQKQQQETEIRQQYDEAAKSPYKVFKGSPTYGTVSFNYPKTWSGYLDSSDNEPINAYFYPDIVPAANGDSKTAYPLRVELVSTDYAQVVSQFTSQMQAGNLKASAFIPPKMKGAANLQPGTRFDGAIGQNDSDSQQGSIVVIKVRDKTLEISTQSPTGLNDFNNIILASLTFVP